MKCPHCQHENPAGTKFCGQCATPLAAICTSCGASNPPANKFCGQCAAPLAKSRALHQETVTVEEVGPLEAAPVLKQYLGETPITRPFFKVSSDAPLAEFVREAPQHPVFLLGPRQ